MEPQTERKALGQVIRALRELEGLSRDELGDRAKLGVDMIAKVEQGAKAPSANALNRLAAALGLDPIDLSNRGLLWAALRDSPEASTALLRSVATGASAALPAFRVAKSVGPAAAVSVVGVAGAAGLAFLSEKKSRRQIEEALRERLEELLAQASTQEDLAIVALALEAKISDRPSAE